MKKALAITKTALIIGVLAIAAVAAFPSIDADAAVPVSFCFDPTSDFCESSSGRLYRYFAPAISE